MVARAVVYDCAGTGDYHFCLPGGGPDLAIGAPLAGFPGLVVVALRMGSGLLPASLRAARREHGAWCAVGFPRGRRSSARSRPVLYRGGAGRSDGLAPPAGHPAPYFLHR